MCCYLAVLVTLCPAFTLCTAFTYLEKASTLGVFLKKCNLFGFFLQGMVLLSLSAEPVCCLQFEADVYVLFHCNKITKNFQTTVHIGTVCQTAVISKINRVSSED